MYVQVKGIDANIKETRALSISYHSISLDGAPVWLLLRNLSVAIRYIFLFQTSFHGKHKYRQVVITALFIIHIRKYWVFCLG